MSNSSWDDKKIENLLKQMPKVEDSRNPSDIYYNVQKQLQKDKRKYWYIPTVAVAAVLLLSFILYPAIFPSNQASESEFNAAEDAAFKEESNRGAELYESKGDLAEDSGVNQQVIEEAAGDKDTSGISSIQAIPIQSALYADQVADGVTPITYAVPDEQGQNVVPVTITVPNNEDETWLEQYLNNVQRIPFEELGLNKDLLPLSGNVSIASDNAAIQIDFPKDHPYANGSLMNRSLLVSLDYTLTNTPYNKVLFKTDGTPGIDLGNLGVQPEQPVIKQTKQPYFILQTKDESEALLTPYIDGSFTTIQDALDAMKEEIDTHSLKGPLKNFTIVSVTENGTELVVDLGKIQVEETDENMLAFEAIMLTAKNFGFETVNFKHSVQQSFAYFSFNTSIKVPVAPNYLEQYSYFEQR
ncbi:hypothetical protein [Bacillus oleivorans]|uniref:hypothetical protein n=1 Tax=Bacillus oleivorans TaxID=1448271 RepID=UPI0033961979